MEYKYKTEEEVKKHEKRRYRHVMGVKAFLLAGVLSSVVAMYVHGQETDKDDLTMSEITKELSIHTGHEITPDGYRMTYADEHHCDVPMDEEQTPFIDRLVSRMSSQYPPEVIFEVKACYEAMYHGNHEDYEAAVERLEEIESKLVQDDNGNYNFMRRSSGLH